VVVLGEADKPLGQVPSPEPGARQDNEDTHTQPPHLPSQGTHSQMTEIEQMRTMINTFIFIQIFCYEEFSLKMINWSNYKKIIHKIVNQSNIHFIASHIYLPLE
jgi:hypothetical protein